MIDLDIALNSDNTDEFLKLISVLETTDKHMTYGKLHHENCYCALGVYGAEVLGVDAASTCIVLVYDAVESRLGHNLMRAVYRVNDEKDVDGIRVHNSFKEVATTLKSHFDKIQKAHQDA